MKKLYTFFAAVYIAASVFAQTPEKMSYQAVIRNNSNQLVTNQQVGMQISILQGSSNGTAVYVETQTPNTNANGLVSIEIGNGSDVSGNFADIDWANGPYFIQTETDPTGGTDYTITGTSQLLSVPYALHAKTAESIAGELSETDPVFSAWDKNYNDLANKPDLANVATSGNYSDLTNKPTIPAVYNSTVTFTGTAVGSSPQTVRLNQSGNKTITINQADVSGFISTETDPEFTNSEAANITATDITNLRNQSGVNTGDQDLSPLATKVALADSTAKVRSEIPDVSGFINTETDPEFTNSEAANITLADITNLRNQSGTNTGDQDLTSLATKTALADSTAKVRSEIPYVSGFITTETDPEFTNSEAVNITAADITNLRNQSGTNTGDQDLTSLATKTALADSTAKVRSEIPDVSGFISTEADPVFTAWDKSTGISITESQISDLDHFTTADETDPIFGTSVASAITGTDITNWNNKQDKLVAGTNISIVGNTINATSGSTLAIGQSYQGGIIFWLDDTGQHGLIAATEDQSEGIAWYNGTYRCTGTTGTGLYAGAMNTTLIVATQIADNETGNFAAKVCADYYVTVDGITYGDWYLPSRYELNLLYQQRNAVGGLVNDYYWNSTENGSNFAYGLNLVNGGYINAGKASTFMVRAIRAF